MSYIGRIKHIPNFGRMNERITLGAEEETSDSFGFVTKGFVEKQKVWAEKMDVSTEQEENGTKILMNFCIRYHASYMDFPIVLFKSFSYTIQERKVVGDYLYLLTERVV